MAFSELVYQNAGTQLYADVARVLNNEDFGVHVHSGLALS